MSATLFTKNNESSNTKIWAYLILNITFYCVLLNLLVLALLNHPLLDQRDDFWLTSAELWMSSLSVWEGWWFDNSMLALVRTLSVELKGLNMVSKISWPYVYIS